MAGGWAFRDQDAERAQQWSKTGNGLDMQNIERAHVGLLEVKITKGAADSEAGVGAARGADDAPAALHFHAPAALLHSCFLPLQPRLVVCRVAVSGQLFRLSGLLLTRAPPVPLHGPATSAKSGDVHVNGTLVGCVDKV